MKRSHSMPFGAEVRPDGSVRFRLWAPTAQRVDLLLEGGKPERLALGKLEQGWFEVVTPHAKPSDRYLFQINDQMKVPDPVSRFQPKDVHGPSEVVDPVIFEWNDERWHGRPWEDTVIYEVHVGTFTPEGTFRAAQEKLDYLRELGVTAVELMPLADFPGSRNWGYDGVLPYAPDSSYGRPEDLKQFVQAAHLKELMVFLDVVYNHFGPEGNYLHLYAPQFFTNRHHTPWGDAINFDGPDSRTVRDFFVHNALYWLEEYHFDGLRLDAVHAIVDDSTPNILTELARTVREKFDAQRLVHLVLENGDNASRYLLRDEQGRVQLYDAQWNDDIHHAAHVLITGESDGYYSDYVREPVRHFCRCLAEGFAYQGEYSEFHKGKRGEPTTLLPLLAFVSFLQNHDQIGNRAFGERIVQLGPGQAVRAVMEILLLAPAPPLLFMGDEFGATTPFLFFCDFHGDLAAAVTNGRRNEFVHFAKFSSPATREQIPDPNAPETFLRSKLDWTNIHLDDHARWLNLYRTLLSTRQKIIVPHLRNVSVAATDFCDAPKRWLSLDWQLGDAVLLQLRANLGDEQVSSIRKQSGDVFYSTSPESAQAIQRGELPPWSVVWSLKK